MNVTAYHMVENLSSGLYGSPGQCLSELLRNGLVACMPSKDRWEPKRGRIEITLVPNHPLSPDGRPVLMVLDNGCGLTDVALDRYFNWLGTPLSQLRQNGKGTHGGASQKGIGRLAALALNENCLHEEVMVRIKNGYYLFTRTGRTGDVRFVQIIPENVEVERKVNTSRFISPTSTELGPLKEIQGSFTAIIIPTPVFRANAEIYEAIKWFLPREQDKMPTLVIGGKPYDPPPLKQEVNVSSRDGRFRARLGAGLPEDEGIWLCDQQTGFRVASCVKLGRSVLPDPLWFPELTGDIFAPNLLRHQDTARSTLARDFLRRTNKEWRNFQMFLIRDVVPFAQQLIERDSIRGNAAETLDEIAQMFHDRFGLPEDRNTTKKSTRNEKIVHQEDPAEPREKKGRGQGNGEVKDAERYRRYISIKVRDEVYHLYRGQSLHPYIFAQVNPDNPHIVYVNVRGGYKALPEQKTARREHCFLQILMAIGKNKYPSDAMQAMLYANEIRGDFLKN